MAKNNFIIEDKEMTQALDRVVQVFEQISVNKMKEARSGVLRARVFMSDMADIFFDVKGSYRKQIEKILEKNKNKKLQFSTFDKTKEKVSVFLSANTKLYGDIIQRVFNQFIKETEKGGDVMIVGRFGRDLYLQSGAKKNYLYFELPDSGYVSEDLQPLIYNLLNYKEINVFHGRYESIITQEVVVTNVTGDTPTSAGTYLSQSLGKQTSQSSTQKYYLFEPSLERILNFFESQVFGGIFKQTIEENQLARFAARIKAMEEAHGRIEKKINFLHTQELRLRKIKDNKKQQESLSGMMLWSQ